MTREKKNPFIQRRKGDPIKYDGRTKPIPLAPEIRWDNAASCPSELTLEIKASPQDWDTLYLLSQASPEYLGKLIGFYVVRPVFEKFLAREGSNLPRGVQTATRQLFLDEARRYAAAAFTILSHWAKRPLTDWPDGLQAEIRQAEKTLGEDNIWVPNKNSPKKTDFAVNTVVKYLLNQKFGSRIAELGLKDVEDIETFQRTYLDRSKLKAAHSFIKEYGDSLTIDVLYEVLPVFPWVSE